jgi:redox-sensitive bicupin YhaK (pirin superfamily)
VIQSSILAATEFLRWRNTVIEKRSFESLGHADHGWLNARHHFSFADYYEPARMGWGAIRVWNDDEIAANSGFPPHPHRDMEIITYVRKGAITHQDSMGNQGRTGAGDVQVMSAGTGVRHAEYNLEQEPTTQVRDARQRLRGRYRSSADPRRCAGARRDGAGGREHHA